MSVFDFDRLIVPLSRGHFFSEYWETKPLRLTRNQPGYYESLITGRDLDYVLSVACSLDRGGVELLGASEYREGSARKPAGDLIRSYRRGASIRVRGINRYWKPIWMLCLRIQELFGFPVGANLYCTPQNSHGLDRHYDLHDTVILQIAGNKNWRVFESPIELPLDHVPLLRFEKSSELVQYREAPIVRDVVAAYKPAAAVDEFMLHPGDLLYLPRGVVHEAWAADSLSAHVTLGIYAVTWLDLIAVALGQQGHKILQLRKALPIGFNKRGAAAAIKGQFTELLKDLASSADVSKALEEINLSLVWNQQAVGEGAITDTVTDSINAGTIVERPPGLYCRFVADGDFVRLVAAHGDLSMPRPFEAALRFVSENHRFQVSAIPGGLSEQSKIKLARRLLGDQFVRVAGDSVPD